MKKFALTFVASLGLFAGGVMVSADEVTHVVKPDDTLSGLALTYGTTIDQLLSLNSQIINPDLIFDGDTLIIATDEPINTNNYESTPEETAPVVDAQPQSEVVETTAQVTQEQVSIPGSGSGVLNPVDGINYYNGVKESYYSQKVLAGGGLNIPGRHVAADGTIRDADNYIVVASDTQAKGSTGQSSLGAYKVYDTGVGHSGIDVYTNW
ncbi:MAG: LysM domain-containing protein [Enterococcus aquimarinus]